MTSSRITLRIVLLQCAILFLTLSRRQSFVHAAQKQSNNHAPTRTAFKRLAEETISPALKNMEYAVRGKVVILADKITDELQAQKTEAEEESSSKKKTSYPFDHIVYTNIGNPQSVGQKALTWPRQVLALVELPARVGVDHPEASKLFPPDAIARAQEIKSKLGESGTGAYSHSQGSKCFRDDIVNFLKERDGDDIPVSADDIFMTNGASSAIQMMFTALIANDKAGVMVPIPQYPIYTALIELMQGHCVGYYLDEKNGWALNLETLEKALEEAESKGIEVNSFVMINPGNPTGQVLSKEMVRDVVSFCSKHNLVLFADEVYQENVYLEGAEFYSAKRAAADLGLLEEDAIELVSFHSTSKGLYGECGMRGGYMELVGIDSFAHDELYKLASSALCSNLPGQVMTSLMVRGPNPGDYSYEKHEAEKRKIFESLRRRSKIITTGLNSIPGFSCQEAAGAMYSFPAVELPDGAIQAAKEKGMAPDTLYALSLLESTGVCVVPASGFGQEEGRWGFRTTFLPSEEEMERAVALMSKHHEDFVAKYSS
mmetsp:Transcript_5542/g.8141  ORF Transcript_5542/g.8141 Transcript_5542/m.8141 type:complete len:544 (-) Transcript_5542:315-1946(-)|eukprot:CAMPEP_0116024872 /NCGR_PEP_ID=MMETSP0321-20121206/12637_1 /TAXON_ID=163516 /ORGANISM="Leptocylindrus danicus var. danicus, Strain B650" /LENGTH=543 /DNA_ID=CAMNT_0003496809 /DNA_START=241 /DNA_END=1872 /DNA_ORIENTATION=+